MKALVISVSLLVLSVVAQADDLKVEIGGVADWKQPILAKLRFDVKVRSLSQILQGDKERSGRPHFLVFTAEAKENLPARLLWIDAEVEMSDGRVTTFKGISFNLLAKGIEAHILKLDGVDTPPFPMDDLAAQTKLPEVRRLKILAATFK